MTRPPLRTVIVGFGRIAAGYQDDPLMARYFPHASHAQTLRAHSGFELVAAVDPAPAARQAAAEVWRIPHVAARVEELPGDLGIAVAVMTQPAASRPAALDALPALRAVMLEKPLGDDGQRFLALCGRRGIEVQVNYWRRGVADFAQLAEGGLLAAIGHAQAAFATYGNGLANNGSHLVDFLRWLLGEVVSAQATGPVRSAPHLPLAGDVDLPFCLTHAGGAQSSVQPLDFRAYREVGVDLWGETARLQIVQESLLGLRSTIADNRALQAEREIASDRMERLDFDVGQALIRLYDNLADALDKAVPLLSDGDNAWRTEAVLQAILASAAAGGRAVSPAAVAPATRRVPA